MHTEKFNFKKWWSQKCQFCTLLTSLQKLTVTSTYSRGAKKQPIVFFSSTPTSWQTTKETSQRLISLLMVHLHNIRIGNKNHSVFKDYFIFTTYSPRYIAADTTQSWGLHKMRVERSYHATIHAKGRQDGFGGVFKTIHRNAVSRKDQLLNIPALISAAYLFRQNYQPVKFYLTLYGIDSTTCKGYDLTATSKN